MHRHFCSLWDMRYMAKGLVMHESLLRHSSEPFTLHVLAMDPDTFSMLYEMQLPNVELIPLSGFEYALNLAGVKAGRTWTEYCWTCASNLLEYLLPWVGPEGCTYLDADLMFFSDPRVIFDEIGERSIGITPHRFPPEHKHKEVNGRFNVGLVYIRNSRAGRMCIERWGRQCREWCFNRIEGKNACGDQKYLDEFEPLYGAEVCAIQNIGVNVAPWNVSQWAVTERLRSKSPYEPVDVHAVPCVDGHPIIFYHAHEYSSDTALTNYALRETDKEFIYKPYIAAWLAAGERIRKVEDAMRERQRDVELQAGRA